ncbi:UPF0175 family protein [Calidifontibacillus oryziterrae]|uniref:UPF0175 family protein n=1 Tax=Calidifontibacillus oryziterrae TaxID=1191699 RepID=UPI00031350CD|nr:UPF0175 family protein [Calidifontibacillus oryziterrae]
MAMEEPKARVGINPDFLPFLQGIHDDSIDEDVNLSLAIYLFTAKKVTLARAAELAGKSIADFIQVLINHNIHWAEYTDEHKKQDDETIEFLLREDGMHD